MCVCMYTYMYKYIKICTLFDRRRATAENSDQPPGKASLCLGRKGGKEGIEGRKEGIEGGEKLKEGRNARN